MESYLPVTMNRDSRELVALMNDTFTMTMDDLIDRLADMYRTDCLAVAKCCDEVLDRSGALLGYVRERHSKLRSLQTQPITAAYNGGSLHNLNEE